MDKIIISNVDEVYVKVRCEEGTSWELREYFTFQVPGYQFTPQYKARLWDGKIRLFDTRTRQIYRGLVPYIVKFCEEYDYEWEYDNEIYDEEFSISEAQDFIKSLNLPFEARDYQLEAFDLDTPTENLTWFIASDDGELPPGLEINSEGIKAIEDVYFKTFNQSKI